jgi:hypothetical protein
MPDEKTRRTVIVQDPTLQAFQGGFTSVPNRLLRSPGLTGSEKLAYMMLLSYGWQDDFCFPAQTTLAADLGLSDRMVRNLLTSLKKKGLIDWKQRGLNQSNIYFILRLPHPFGEEAVAGAGPTNATKDRKPISGPGRKPISRSTRKSTAGQGRKLASDYKDSKKNTQIDVNVETINESPKASSPENPTDQEASQGAPFYSGEALEAKIAQLREGLRDRGKSDFNVRQIVKRLPPRVVDEAYYQAVQKAQDDHLASPASYFVGICKIRASESRVDLGFRGRGEPENPARRAVRVAAQTARRSSSGLESLKDSLTARGLKKTPPNRAG